MRYPHRLARSSTVLGALLAITSFAPGQAVATSVGTVREPSALTRAPQEESAFPGANGKIVFRGWDGTDFEIYVIDAAGTNLTQLTFNAGSEADPSFSPNGNKIAWVSEGNVWKMNADGSNQVQLTTTPQSEVGVGWSPDGRHMVVARDYPSGYELVSMRANGADARRITTTPWGETNPTWSPDGALIAYDRTTAGSSDEIFLIRPDGTGTTRLTFTDGSSLLGSWHPGGHRLLYFNNGTGDYEIFRMRRDGSDVTQITTNTWDDQYPAYSPDGTRMVWTDRLDGDLELVQSLVASPGGAVQLTFNTNGDYDPDWQPV